MLTTDPRLPHALAYLANGRAVFVLGRSKRPLANCRACSRAVLDDDPGHDRDACGCLTCHGFYAATHDPDRARAQLAAVPSGLLAVRTGAVSGLVVVDIDPRHGGRIDPDLMPRTALVATAGGGWHLLYRHPGTEPIRSRPLPGAVGVDVKADGGYVAAPPSTLPDGRGYRWVLDIPPAEMPPALLAACRTDPPDAPAVPLTTTSRTPLPGPYAPRGGGGITSPEALLSAHLAAVLRAPHGRRRATLYGASRGVARMVAAGALTPERAWEHLRGAGQTAGQTRREIRAAILDGFRDEGVPTTPPADDVRGAA